MVNAVEAFDAKHMKPAEETAKTSSGVLMSRRSESQQSVPTSINTAQITQLEMSAV